MRLLSGAVLVAAGSCAQLLTGVTLVAMGSAQVLGAPHMQLLSDAYTLGASCMKLLGAVGIQPLSDADTLGVSIDCCGGGPRRCVTPAGAPSLGSAYTGGEPTYGAGLVGCGEPR